MAYAKDQRQRAIADLIRSSVITSQQDLAEQLSGRGFEATQATISRDLEQIGAIKARRSGQLAYSLAADAAEIPGPRYETLLREYARTIQPATNLVVIKTPPGTAHLIGVALDHTQVPEIVGTICGDDTIFIACHTPAEAQALGNRLRTIAFGG